MRLAWLLGAAAGLYVLFLAGLYAVQRRMLFMPDTARPSLAQLGVQEVAVTAADGLPLLAWWLPPGPGQPVMLYLHGNGGNLGNRRPRMRGFAGQGWGVLMLEWRGYGGNPGAPSEAGFVSDAKGAMAHLARLGFGPGQVVLYGESIGTGVAVRIASEQPVAALVLESPYTSVADLARQRMPFVPVGLLLRDPFDLLGRMDRVQAPLLVLQGARDQVVPPAMGRAVFAAAREPKQLWVAETAGHNDIMGPDALAVLTTFVRRHGPGAAP